MDIVAESSAILRRAGFATIENPAQRQLVFEDEAVLGYIQECEGPEVICDSWQAVEEAFLVKHAPAFRGTEKAWNIYSVFLCIPDSDAKQAARLTGIEENFISTRKIARAGIIELSTLITALAPLLRIQNSISLDKIDFERRLIKNLSAEMPTSLAAELLSKSSSIESLLRHVVEDKP